MSDALENPLTVPKNELPSVLYSLNESGRRVYRMDVPNNREYILHWYDPRPQLELLTKGEDEAKS